MDTERAEFKRRRDYGKRRSHEWRIRHARKRLGNPQSTPGTEQAADQKYATAGSVR